MSDYPRGRSIEIAIEVEGGTEVARQLEEVIAFMGSPEKVNSDVVSAGSRDRTR